MTDQKPASPFKRTRVRFGLATCLFGLLVFILGARPEWFGLDRSPVIGFVQIAVFIIGLGIICVGGYLVLAALWNGTQKSIVSDIGLRLVSTGFVIAVASGMADVFGFGSQLPPITPEFGFLQTIGVLVGEIVIGVGFLMLIPYQRVTD